MNEVKEFIHLIMIYVILKLLFLTKKKWEWLPL